MADGVLEARVRELIGDVGTFTTAQITAALKDNLSTQAEESRLSRVSGTLYREYDGDARAWACGWTPYAASVEVDETALTALGFTADAITRELTLVVSVDEDSVVEIEVWRVNIFHAAADLLNTYLTGTMQTGGRVIRQGDVTLSSPQDDIPSLRTLANDLRARGNPAVLTAVVMR